MASTGVWFHTRYMRTGSPETPSSETLIDLQIGRTRNSSDSNNRHFNQNFRSETYTCGVLCELPHSSLFIKRYYLLKPAGFSFRYLAKQNTCSGEIGARFMKAEDLRIHIRSIRSLATRIELHGDPNEARMLRESASRMERDLH